MQTTATILQFNGGLDEAWFYLITTNMEQVGAKGIPLLVDTIAYAKNEQPEKACTSLLQIAGVLNDLTIALRRMYEQLDPHIFYKRVRPFLSSFENITYGACQPAIRNYHGGSAAQSSLLQAFDTALGMNYENIPRTKDYLLQMRQHMPPKHAAFLHYLETESTIHNFAKANNAVKKSYQEAIKQLIELRNEHLKMVAIYVIKEATKNNQDALGTGGTNPLHFLKSIRNRNEDLSMEVDSHSPE